MTTRSMMMRTILADAAILLLLGASGCDHVPDHDLSPIMAPVENQDADANAYRDWQPTDEQLALLAATRAKCKGRLPELLDHAKWSGRRLRVTGMRGGLPVTEDIGPWHIIVVPTSDQSVVEIKGLLFAKALTVKLDVNRDVLIVEGSEFPGRPITGNSPMFGNAGFRGVHFGRQSGLTMGSASILLLDDGRLSMDFHKTVVNGTRAGEYGVLEPCISEE